MRRRYSGAAVCLAVALLSLQRSDAAAATWFEIRSPHLTVWAEANNGATRTLVWQLEQVRHIAKNLWPWMNVVVSKPLVVVAVKDEQSMKRLAPKFWEGKDAVRPVSVSVSAADQNYIAIQTNIATRDDVMVNPHSSAYFSYANLMISASLTRKLPLWVSRGLAGVLSNTLIRQNDVLIGAPIPWHLESLRSRRLPLSRMLSVTRTSPELSTADGLNTFSAHSWAFVHFLMFGNEGRNSAKLNAFIAALERGEAEDRAFASSIGNVDDYEREFASYVNRSLYSVARVKGDMGIDRERFPARQMSAVETTLAQASFHVAMQRPAEARALLAEVQKADAASAGASVLEALLLESQRDTEGAKAMYATAVARGTTDPYALYRYAMLHRRDADAARLEEIEKHLARAVEVRPQFAFAHAALAEARADLKRPQHQIVPSMHKAVALEPSEPWHRIVAARILARLDQIEEAQKTLEAALELASDDPGAKAEAERVLGMLKSRQR